MRPVRDIWVVLHRVASDSAGPLDSMRTRTDGRFAFRYSAAGGDDAIYFVSAQYGGIAYFSAPLRRADVTGDDAEVAVFDTTSASLPLRVRGRHVIISSPGVEGAREVAEVFELSNDSSLTLVSSDGRAPTWSSVTPRGAQDVRAGGGDVAPGALHATDGRVLVLAPFAPGLKQVSYAYTVLANAFPISIPIERATDVLEVLVEEAETRVSGAKLVEGNPVIVEGRSFKRYFARDVGAGAQATITLGASARRSSKPIVLVIAVVGGSMLLALAFAFLRPRRFFGHPPGASFRIRARRSKIGANRRSS